MTKTDGMEMCSHYNGIRFMISNKTHNIKTFTTVTIYANMFTRHQFISFRYKGYM